MLAAIAGTSKLNDAKKWRRNISFNNFYFSFFSAIRDHRLGDCLKNFRAAPGAERKTFLTRYPPGSSVSDDNGARM